MRLGQVVFEVLEHVPVAIPVNGDEVDAAASSAGVQEISKPLETSWSIGDCRSAQVGSIDIGIDVTDVSFGCILRTHAGLSVAAFVGFIEGEKMVGAAGEGVVDIAEPLER